MDQFRIDLCAYLESLSDPQWQQRVWVEKGTPEGGAWDSLEEVVHFFFDDTTLAEDCTAAVGVFLRDRREADAVSAVVNLLDEVISSDVEALSHEKWPEVVSAASEALELLRKGHDPSQGPLSP